MKIENLETLEVSKIGLKLRFI